MLCLCLLLAAAPAAYAQAEKRLALLIGNQAYGAGVGPLKNPHNDIRIVGAALAKVGFQVLTPVKDATRDRLLTAVHEFADKLKAAGPDTVGFLYYAGHGVAVGSDNIVVPVNVQGTTRRELEISGVRLGEIIGILNEGAPQAVHFVVFDACRNLVGSSRGTRGFVPIAERPGMLIAFSTAPNSPASDGEDKGSGPYAAALSQELVAAGRYHGDMFFEVRTKVAAATGQEQVPWTQDGLLRRVHFGGEKTVAVPPPPAKSHATEAAEAWAVTKDTTSIATLEAFVRRFGDTYYGDLAKMRLDDLRRAEAAKSAADTKAKAESEAKAKAEAERICANVAGIANVQLLTTMASQHKGTRAGECIATRIDVLQREKAAAADPPLTKGLYPQPLTPDRERALKPKETFRECHGCPEMVVVPAGRFTRGSPANEPERIDGENQVPVIMGYTFAVGRFAVTRGEFAAFVAATSHKMEGDCSLHTETGWVTQSGASWRSPGFEQSDRHPVTCVNWHDARAYATWMSAKTGKTYRLLSEVEREYVTRAGTSSAFWWGPTITPANANYRGTAEVYKGGGVQGPWRKATLPVDAFIPNPWGLYQVHGNVYEWLETCWSDAREPFADGVCIDGAQIRGGSWSSYPSELRSAARGFIGSGTRGNVYGFRVARRFSP